MNAPLGVWSIMVEFTLPVTEEDLRVRYEGDAECDLADRAIERIIPKLNAMCEGGREIGWCIRSQSVGERRQIARRCVA